MQKNHPTQGDRNSVPLHLPPELWEMIFGHLASRHLLHVRRTCRYWRDIVDGSVVLKDNFQARFGQVSEFSALFPIVRQYDLRCWYPAQNVLIQSVKIVELPGRWWALMTANLTSLEVSSCRISFPVFLVMLQGAPSLKKLTLLDTFFVSSATVDVKRFQFDGIRYLDLKNSNGLMLCKMLDIFGKVLTHVKYFELRSPLQLKREIASVVNFIRKQALSLESIDLEAKVPGTVRLLCKLDGLQLKRFWFRGNGHEPGMFKLLLKNPALEHVSVTHTGLSFENLLEIGRNLPHLKYLLVTAVKEERDLNISTFKPLFLTTMIGLEELFFDSTPAEQYVDFSEHGSPNLRSVTFVGLSIYTSSYFRCFPNIHTLVLNRCYFTDLAHIFSMVSQLEHLREFTLSEADVYNWEGEFTETYENLQTLRMFGCKWMETELMDLFQRCPNLRELDLRWTAVNDEILRVLCAHTKRLSKLRFCKCEIEESSALQVIAHFYPLMTIERLPVVLPYGVQGNFIVNLYPNHFQNKDHESDPLSVP